MSAIATTLIETPPTLSTAKTPTDSPSRSVQFAELANEAPHSTRERDPVDAITPEMRKREKIVLASMLAALFTAGWNDGTIGPLLPRVQHVYGVGFTVVSMIFISGCVGFICGSVANIYLTDRLKFGSIIIGAALCQVVTYAVQAAAPPFPIFCIFFFINGFGVSLQDAQANGLVASLHENAEEKMGLLHAVYGFGALCSPLVATQFAQLPRWSFHFLVSLAIAIANVSGLFCTVRGQSLEGLLKSMGSPMADAHVSPTNSMELQNTNGNMTVQEENEVPPSVKKGSIIGILRQGTVQLMAAFILVYVGVEVTIGGWIVTFIINVRGGGPSSGYISSGFFGGLTLGRIILLPLNRRIGERRVVFLYAALAIGLELVIWLVPSLIGNAVAVSIVGILLGPMYPLCMNHAGRVLPRKILTASIGWIAGFGQAGSAILPFMTGALASRFGIKSLQPLLVSMMAFMTVLWALVPGHSKRAE